MSQSRFAPITASLLARKGNAMPSTMTAMPSLPPAPFGPQPSPPPSPMVEKMDLRTAQPPVMHEPEPTHDAPHHDPSRPKKLFVPMTHDEHERLAIAAVKTGFTKHQIVRDALEMYFEQLSADLGEDCACITGGFASPNGKCCRS